MSEPFKTHLSVDRSVVELLSKSTYQRNFSYALREMVSNAYDADATKVSIDLSTDQKCLLIHDDGSGMSKEDFDFYLRIAGKKRGKPTTSRFKRQRIGQFGVGFLSIFPFCEFIEIRSTIEGSDDVLSATIPSGEFFKLRGQINVEALPINGVIARDSKQRSNHYTAITLKNLTTSAKLSFGLSAEVSKRRVNSIRTFPPLERLRWELQDELPIRFSVESPYAGVFPYSETQSMQVYLNGRELWRNDAGGELIDSGELEVDGYKARFCLTTPWKAVAPIEMRGVKLRVQNVGVGGRTDFEIPRTRPYSHLSWICGELHLPGSLSESISVSRDTFVDNPVIQEFYDKMAARLRKQATFIENIEKNKNLIERHISHGKQKRVAPTETVVSEGVRQLEQRGFKVERIATTSSNAGKTAAVEVDTSARTVRIVEDHPALEDVITIGGVTYKVIYQEGTTPKGRPCLINQDRRIIEVFSSYPLFRSKRYGEVFEKVLILLAVASREAASREEVEAFMLRELQALFKGYV